MVTGGLRVGDDIRMMFNDQSASIYRSPFGTHGLLTGVYLPTNPDSVSRHTDLSRANYQLGYSRSAPTENDPQSRWVLSEVIERDGVCAGRRVWSA